MTPSGANPSNTIRLRYREVATGADGHVGLLLTNGEIANQ